MIDFQVAFDKLAGFTSGHEIADFLKSQGIIGTVGATSQCPIANWVQAQTGEIARVYVEQEGEVGIGLTVDDVHIYDQPATQAIAEFIWAFDAGMFPELSDGLAKVVLVGDEVVDGSSV